MNKTITPLEYWSNVWTEGVIRFHQAQYNSQMTAYFNQFDLTNKTVLIPLAGKSKDILYFLERGAIVTAIEFCEQAVVDFFTENKIEFTKVGNCFKAKNLSFYACDFFNFHTDTSFDVLYDRASQVVFGKNDRPKYFDHVLNMVTSKSLILLFSVDHAGDPDYGPPFKIPKTEIMEAYKNKGITLTEESTTTEVGSEKMQAAGINTLITFTLKNPNPEITLTQS